MKSKIPLLTFLLTAWQLIPVPGAYGEDKTFQQTFNNQEVEATGRFAEPSCRDIGVAVVKARRLVLRPIIDRQCGNGFNDVKVDSFSCSPDPVSERKKAFHGTWGILRNSYWKTSVTFTITCTKRPSPLDSFMGMFRNIFNWRVKGS